MVNSLYFIKLLKNSAIVKIVRLIRIITKQTIILFVLFILIQCSGNKKEFTIWIGGAPQEIEFWQKQINRFRDSTGIDINLVRQPTYSDQRRQSLIVALQAKQPNPDLFLMDVIWVNQFYRSGWLVPLDDYIKNSNLTEDILFEKALALVDRYNDTLYALPVFMDVALLYYREDLLNKHGIENPPETWEQLVDYSKQVIKEEGNGLNGFVWQGSQYEGLVCVFLEFIKSNEGGIKTNGKIKLDYQANVDALKFMQDLIHKHNVSPQNTYTEMKEEEVRRSFQRGNALFERNWTYAAKLHALDESNVRNKFGIAELPHFEDGRSYSTMGGWHIGLSKYSDVKEEAWKFIEYVTSYEFQKEMILEIGWNPVRKDIYSDEEIINFMPYIKIMEEAFNSAAARPSLPYYTQVSEIVQRNVNQCLSGSISAEQAVNKMQEEVDELTKLYE